MRYQNLFRRIAFSATVAGSILCSGIAQANYDFEALLADIDFGTPEVAAQVEAPAATELTTTPAVQEAAPEPISDPQPAAEEAAPLPAAPAPVPMPVASTDGVVSGDQCCGQCSNDCHSCGHGHKDCSLFKEGFCQPYMPPRLPTSTLYQYWRSNACNVHVWDGFRNRCHSHMDSCLNKSHCGNGHCGGDCAGGCAGNCGPIPAEWSGCDNCDG